MVRSYDFGSTNINLFLSNLIIILDFANTSYLLTHYTKGTLLILFFIISIIAYKITIFLLSLAVLILFINSI